MGTEPTPHNLRNEAHKARTLIIKQPVIDRWALRIAKLLDETADKLEQTEAELSSFRETARQQRDKALDEIVRLGEEEGFPY